jgi:hypothetical protein
MVRCKGLLIGAACWAVLALCPVGARADDTGNSDGFAALAVLMGVGVEVAVEHVKIQDKAFIDQCTDAKIDRWRAKDVRVSSLWDAKKLEDECVLDAVAMEAGRIKAEADAEAKAAVARVAEAEAISDRLKAARDAKQVVAASGPVAVKGSLKGRRRVEYLANGSVQVNW